jgi:HD-like signal output (HDOD) protein
MLDRILLREPSRTPLQENAPRQNLTPPASSRGDPVDAGEYEQRLYTIYELPPISPVLLDVFYMAKSDHSNAEQLAANIARDAFLAAEVLRMASSAFYNPLGREIRELRLAVARLGWRTIAALALSRHTLRNTWSGWSHFFDAQLAWRQSVGAGVAVEMILEHGRHQASSDELFLCALMHSLGRMILLSLFPEVYQGLVENAQRQQSTLLAEELRVFPESHSATMQRLLTHWGIAASVHAPLQHFTSRYDEVGQLNEPLRSQVEAVKLAALIGGIAAGSWQRWEQIELPSTEVLARLNVDHTTLGKIIEQTKIDTAMLCSFGTQGSDAQLQSISQRELPPNRCVAYRQPRDFNWLSYLLPVAGIEAERTGTSEATGPIIEFESQNSRVLVNGCEVVRLPCSFALLERQLGIDSKPAADVV